MVSQGPWFTYNHWMGSTSTDNSGILSDIFNFVSREFNSFMTNTTGLEHPLLLLLSLPFNSRVLGTVNIPGTLDDSEFSREASLVESEAPCSQKILPQIFMTPIWTIRQNERDAKYSWRKHIKKVVASSEEGELYFLGFYHPFCWL